MFETSRDILNIAGAFSLVLVAVFICILLYQFISIIREIRVISKLVREKLNLIDSLLHTIKDKLEHSASYITMLVGLVEKIVDYQKKRRTTPIEDSQDDEE